MALNFAQKYRVFARSDSRYDGAFYVAVRTTGIFCLPSCRARKPKRDHVRFFPTVMAAKKAGFRPCRRCRPELPLGARGAERAWFRRLQSLLEEGRPLPVGRSRLCRLFRKYEQVSPRAWLVRRRIEKACRLLRENRPALEVCFACGFSSAGSFYRWFRRLMGTTPRRFSSA